MGHIHLCCVAGYCDPILRVMLHICVMNYYQELLMTVTSYLLKACIVHVRICTIYALPLLLCHVKCIQ